MVTMRHYTRGSLGCFTNVRRKLGRRGIIISIFVLMVILGNFILSFLFSAITPHQECSQIVDRSDLAVNGKTRITSCYINDLITNLTEQGLEGTISIKDLITILQLSEYRNYYFQLNYTLNYLLHNSTSLGVSWQSLCNSFRNSATNPSFGAKDNVLRALTIHKTQKRSHYTSNSTIRPISFQAHNNASKINIQSQLEVKNSTYSRLRNREHKDEYIPIAAKTLGASTKQSSSGHSSVDSNGFPGKPNSGKAVTGVNTNTTKLRSCVEYTTGLYGVVKPVIREKSPQAIADMFPQLQSGGHYTPRSCIPKEKTAIVIPYRDRYSHLHILLLNILPLLIKQNVDFTIIVVEQQIPGPFNRAMLFNVGFLESLKMTNFDCFIFHDVDLIPISEKNYYHCNNQPTHFVSGVDKFKYKLMYQNMFGGVVALTQKQFRDINGASNLYFGWGGEDDDLRRRVLKKGYQVKRKDSAIGLYDMIKHKRDDSNQANPFRGETLKLAQNTILTEGLNTTIYTTTSVELSQLYTWVQVWINITQVLMTAPENMNKLREKLLGHYLETQSTVTGV